MYYSFHFVKLLVDEVKLRKMSGNSKHIINIDIKNMYICMTDTKKTNKCVFFNQ